MLYIVAPFADTIPSHMLLSSVRYGDVFWLFQIMVSAILVFLMMSSIYIPDSFNSNCAFAPH